MPWDSSNGCAYGDIRLSVPDVGELVPELAPGEIPEKWPMGTGAEAGHFSTTFRCTMPDVISSGTKTLNVKPTVY